MNDGNVENLTFENLIYRARYKTSENILKSRGNLRDTNVLRIAYRGLKI